MAQSASVLSANPTVRERRALGTQAFQRNDLQGAVELLEPVKQAPGPPEETIRALRLLARCHIMLGDLTRAEDTARNALSFAPEDASTLCLLAQIYNNVGKYDRAYEALRDVDASQISHGHIHIFCQVMVKQGDYAKFNELGDIFTRLREIAPRDLVHYLGVNGMRNRLFDEDSLERYFDLQRKWGESMMAEARENPLPADTLRNARANRTADGRLRVGFFALSNIFETQSVLRPMLRHLDRSVFDARFAFIENGPGVITDESFTALFEETVTIPRGSTREVAIKLAEMGCDILIDLNGMQQPATYVGALAWRPAPLQLSWTGRPITCALPALDYNIVDDVLGGDGSGCLSAPCRLPNAFACFGPMPDFEPVSEVPSETTGTITYAINAEPAKFNLRTIDMWAAVLRSTEGARAVFMRPEYKSSYLRQNILAAFAARGVPAERIAFWYQPPEERRGHMRLYDHVDVLLDCYPMTGGIGMTEALHMGVPAVSLEGPAIQLRVGASHLHAVALDDLRAHSVDDYVEKAVGLARDVDRRRRLRHELRARVTRSAFVDVQRFAADFNATLKQTAREHFGGLEPSAPLESERTTMSNEQTVTIAGVTYKMSELSEEAHAQLANVRATDQEIQRLRTQLRIAQTARESYVGALKAELPGREEEPPKRSQSNG